MNLYLVALSSDRFRKVLIAHLKISQETLAKNHFNRVVFDRKRFHHNMWLKSNSINFEEFFSHKVAHSHCGPNALKQLGTESIIHT